MAPYVATLEIVISASDLREAHELTEALSKAVFRNGEVDVDSVEVKEVM